MTLISLHSQTPALPSTYFNAAGISDVSVAYSIALQTIWLYKTIFYAKQSVPCYFKKEKLLKIML